MCGDGRHFLDGQEDENGELIGISKPNHTTPKTARYDVIIDPLDTIYEEGTRIEHVLEYRMLSDRVFYVAGTDFENWFCLHPGQAVQVTETVQ